MNIFARDSLRIIATGDVSLNGRYHAMLAETNTNPLRAVHGWRESDLVVANFESPITNASRIAPSKCTLRGSDNAKRIFGSHHFRVVSIANNHMMDFGPTGLEDTQAYLDECAIRYCGGGWSLADASKPLIIEHCSKRVGFLAFCNVEQASPLYAESGRAGIAPWRAASSIDQIRDLRRDVDWLIVMLHWGVEMSRLPSVGQREMARLIVAAGADVILGSHPHVLQPIEEIEGKIVAYSLGNFLFSSMYWRGVKTDGEKFCSKLRLHRLSRRTGWLQIDLKRGHPTQWVFHPARLTRSLAISPGWPRRWQREWAQMNRMLHATDYKSVSEDEIGRAHNRTRKRWSGKPFMRRVELKLYQIGIIPGTKDST